MSPPNSSAPRAAPRRGAAWRRRRPSCNARPRSRSIRHAAPSAPSPPRRPSTRPATPTPRSTSSRWPSRARSTNSSAHARSGFAHGSRSRSGAAATRRRSCCARPSGWHRSRPSSRARRTSKRSARRSPPASATSLDRASAALRAAPAPDPPRAGELLLTGQALVITDGRAAGVPVLKQALSAFRSEPISGEEEMRGLLYACLVAIGLWDDESWHLLSERYVRLARDAGALTVLPLALEMHCASQVNAGEFAAAQALIDEADAITAAAGSVPLTDAADPARRLARRRARGARADRARRPRRHGSGRGDARSRWRSTRPRCSSTGSAVTPAALAAAQRSCEHHPAKVYPRALIEIVEAAARSGRARARGGGARAPLRGRRRSAAPTGRWGWRPVRARC